MVSRNKRVTALCKTHVVLSPAPEIIIIKNIALILLYLEVLLHMVHMQISKSIFFSSEWRVHFQQTFQNNPFPFPCIVCMFPYSCFYYNNAIEFRSRQKQSSITLHKMNLSLERSIPLLYLKLNNETAIIAKLKSFTLSYMVC